MEDIYDKIKQERERQIKKGYDALHDDMHETEDIALGAAVYAIPPYVRTYDLDEADDRPPKLWPFDARDWHPHPERERELIKAAAMIIAEIERLRRLG